MAERVSSKWRATQDLARVTAPARAGLRLPGRSDRGPVTAYQTTETSSGYARSLPPTRLSICFGPRARRANSMFDAFSGLTIAELASVSACEVAPVELTDAYLGRIEAERSRLARHASADAAAIRLIRPQTASDRDHRLLASVPRPCPDRGRGGRGEAPGCRHGLARQADHARAGDRRPGSEWPVPASLQPLGPRPDAERVQQRVSSGRLGGDLRRRPGSDTPATLSRCGLGSGIVGHKPTDLVSRRGVLPLSWALDPCRSMTRTVEDAAILLRRCG
jgi:hypothetical protein